VLYSPEHALVMRPFGQVQELMGQFPPITPLALLLKQFLADRSLDHPYKGGLSSYCQVNGIFHVP
jgi:DNA polymerase sigma